MKKKVKGSDIFEYIEAPLLFEAIGLLPDKKREVLSLAYIHCQTDTEIAKRLNTSQQSVSKTHKRALECKKEGKVN